MINITWVMAFSNLESNKHDPSAPHSRILHHSKPYYTNLSHDPILAIPHVYEQPNIGSLQANVEGL